MSIEYNHIDTASSGPITGRIALLSLPVIGGNRDLADNRSRERQPTQPRSAAEAGIVDAPKEEQQTALLVDDEPAIRNLMETVLTALGYQVFAYGDGDEALGFASFYDGTIDLLVTDLVMPRVSGVELAHQMLKEHPGLSVLLMSGFSPNHRALHELMTNRSGVGFLRKPFSLVELERTLRALEPGDPNAPATPC